MTNSYTVQRTLQTEESNVSKSFIISLVFIFLDSHSVVFSTDVRVIIKKKTW